MQHTALQLTIDDAKETWQHRKKEMEMESLSRGTNRPTASVDIVLTAHDLATYHRLHFISRFISVSSRRRISNESIATKHNLFIIGIGRDVQWQTGHIRI